MNIAVFCSGNGSNFQAIVDASRKGLFKGRIALMVCDRSGAYAVKRAEKEKIKTLVIELADFPSKEKFEARIVKELKKERIGLICLAGYMRMLSPGFVESYRDRILNIHPAILPLFKGTRAIRDALDHGVKVTGVTVHFVNEDMDAGPVILQERVRIKPDDTEESLAKRIHNLEHRLYPKAIKLFTQGKLKIIGRTVRILTAAAIFLLIFGLDSKAMFIREASFPLPPLVTPVFYRDVPPVLLQQKEVLLPAEADSLPIEKDAKLNLIAYNKLELGTLPLYDIGNYTDSGQSRLLNPDLDLERPLTKEELEKMKIEGSIKIARAFAEAMDSMNAKFAYKGINSLIDTTTKVIGFRNHIGNKYNLHFKLDKEQALFRYKKQF